MKLVSLITCIYNTEETLKRYFDSVLVQDYARIQFILVNDGSTDGSHLIIDEYREKFDTTFEDFVYLEKENGGCSSAINYALPYVRGEYLTVADGDDVLERNNISCKARFLDNNKEYGIVLNQAVEIFENGEKHNMENRIGEGEVFFDKLINFGVSCYAGAYMICSDLLWDKIPERSIYCRREVGAHLQLLAPIAYDHKCGVLDDVLYYRYYYSNSDCHRFNYDQIMNNFIMDDEYFRGVLSFMKDNTELSKNLYEQRRKSIKKLLDNAFIHNDNAWFKMGMDIDRTESLGLYKSDIIQKEYLMRIKKKIILYGFGLIGKEFYSFWKDRIKIVIDNNIKADFIFEYSEVKEKIDEYEDVVVIASVNYKEHLYSQVKNDYENINIVCL